RRRMRVMQVYGRLVGAEAGGGGRQAVFESHKRRHAIGIEDRRTWVLTIEAPDVGRQVVTVELMGAGLQLQLISHRWREFGPTLMRVARGLAVGRIGSLGRRRSQKLRDRRRRDRQVVDKRRVWRALRHRSRST